MSIIHKATTAALHWWPVPFRGVTHIPKVGDTLSIAKHRLLLDIRPEGLSSQQIMRIREAYEQSWNTLPLHLQELKIQNKVKTVIGVDAVTMLKEPSEIRELLKKSSSYMYTKYDFNLLRVNLAPRYHDDLKRIYMPLKTYTSDAELCQTLKAKGLTFREIVEAAPDKEWFNRSNASADHLRRLMNHESSHAVGNLLIKDGYLVQDHPAFLSLLAKESEKVKRGEVLPNWNYKIYDGSEYQTQHQVEERLEYVLSKNEVIAEMLSSFRGGGKYNAGEFEQLLPETAQWVRKHVWEPPK